MAARLPPLGAIEAFAAAARTQSFTTAARELNLTTSAISRRVAALEAALGVRLFHRLNRALRLTAAGERYLAAIAPAIDALRAAGASLQPSAPGARLTLCVLPSFAALWLLPRLAAFGAAHPTIDLRIATAQRAPEAGRGDIDMAVTIGTGDWPGWSAERLLPMRCRPVCAPRLRLKAPQDLRQHALLGVSQPRGFWRRWCAEAGLPPFRPVRTLRFDGLHLLYEAAAGGLGVALAFDDLVQPYLDDGRLVEPFGTSFVPQESWWLLHRARDARSRGVTAVRRWLKAQAHMSSRA
ncbi:LysR substrate-binding domain-containing protein [Vineibacter terrae]|uniref:LysR substrate-binding domain-containing protein n=1 Tax=Vineibacter terrae TaxID=2586908 RepID=UPI002E34C507|nr:LysR substrate-binding domain-containing protein [Vineibacter terrae]HEX2891829.1 LysR substrate-binding domain-containing protein [Vineibacter terrae]